MNVEYSEKAIKKLDLFNKSDKGVSKQILEILKEIGDKLCDKQYSIYKIIEPLRSDRTLYKIRVGKYRIFISIRNDGKAILVHSVEKRGRACN